MKVGYQGAHGTFSEIAVQRYFEGKDIEARNYTNFVDILNDLDAGILDAAMLPVENSTTGTIYRTYDLRNTIIVTNSDGSKTVYDLSGNLIGYKVFAKNKSNGVEFIIEKGN